MDDTKDFSFCQVVSQVDHDHLESPKAMPKIHDAMVKINSSNGPSIDESTASSLPSSIQFALDGAARAADITEPETDGTLPINNSLDHTVSHRSGADGSWSVKIVNISPPKLKLSEIPESTLLKTFGDSTNGSAADKKTVTQKPSVRKKVPFEKGHSQMDWLRLTRNHPDLAGIKGQSNRSLISMDEVKQHQTEDSIWTVLKGRVYNIAPYMKFHPGGADMLMKAAGKDCTSLFNKYHAWVNAEFLLEKCLVGTLDAS